MAKASATLPRGAATPSLAGVDVAATPATTPAATPAVSDRRQAELDALAHAFKRVFRNLRRLRGRDTHAAGTEVTHAQFELLIELYERGPLSAGELASAAQLTPATVTQMLDHLAAGGLVERARSQQDRRIVVTRLTALGKRRVNAKRALWHSRWQQALADIASEDLRTATDVLDRLGAIFGDEPSSGGRRPPVGPMGSAIVGDRREVEDPVRRPGAIRHGDSDQIADQPPS